MAEGQVSTLTARLAALHTQEAKLSARDKCLLALELKVNRVDILATALKKKNEGGARRSSLLAMTREFSSIIGQLGERLGVGTTSPDGSYPIAAPDCPLSVSAHPAEPRGEISRFPSKAESECSQPISIADACGAASATCGSGASADERMIAPPTKSSALDHPLLGGATKSHQMESPA